MIGSIENDFLKISVKNSGAELIGIKNKKNNYEYLWQGDPKFWARRAPILFPIVGKLKDNTYKAEGKSFQLLQHGFARDMHFELIEKENSFLIYSLKHSAETLKNYPYKFELFIKYDLSKNTLKVTYEVRNMDSKKMLFSIGGHPAFNCPIVHNEKFNDCFLEFETKENAERYVLKDGLLTTATEPVLKDEKILPLNHELFAKDALVFKGLKSEYVALKSRRSKAKLTFNFKGFPYLGIWSKPGPFVCIEPWYGHADYENAGGELKDKEGILSLEKGKIFSCDYKIEID